MTDIFLYSGQPNPNDVILSDPTVQRSGGVTSVAVSDLGSAVESTPDVLAFLIASDTGSGVEATPSILAIVAGSDTGSGADTSSILALVPMSDSGSGAESTPSILSLAPLSDTGSAVESVPVILALVSISDAGSGLEASPNILALIPLVDTGSGSESLSILALLAVVDAGSGVESIPGILATVGVSDNGSGVEGFSVTATVLLSDAGSGMETPAILDLAPASDAGSGSESLGIFGLISGSEVGSGVEAQGLLATASVSDNASGLDDVGVTAEVTVADDGSAAEQAIQINDFSTVLEEGVGEESVDILRIIKIHDYGYGLDYDHEGAFVLAAVNEVGVGIEEISVVKTDLYSVTPSSGGGSGSSANYSLWGEANWQKKIKFMDRQLTPVGILHGLVATATKKRTQAPHPSETLPIRRVSPSHVEKELRREVKVLRHRVFTLEGQATEKRQQIKFMTEAFGERLAAADLKSAAAEQKAIILETRIGDLERRLLERPIFSLPQAAPWYVAGGTLGIVSFFLKDVLRVGGILGAVTCTVIGTIEGFQKRD